MRDLVYKLADGTTVKTLREAEASGQSYIAEMRTRRAERAKLSPIRKAMIEQFGYVSAKFKDRVVL